MDDPAPPAFDLPHICERLEIILSEIAGIAYEVPGWILTESDFKCVLYQRLMNIPGLALHYPSADPQVLGTMIHTELAWFDAKGLLRLRPDMTILDPAALSVLGTYTPPPPFSPSKDNRPSWTIFEYEDYRLTEDRRLGNALPPEASAATVDAWQRKGYAFDGAALCLELKLIRAPRVKEGIIFARHDAEKCRTFIEMLMARGHNTPTLVYQVVLVRDLDVLPEVEIAHLRKLIDNTQNYHLRWLQNGRVYDLAGRVQPAP